MQKKRFSALFLFSILFISIDGFSLNDAACSTHEIDKRAATQTITDLFEDLYKQVDEQKAPSALQDRISYKEIQHSLNAFQFSDSVEVGFESMKSNAFKLQKNEIGELNSYLDPKAAKLAAARAYGIQMKVRLD